MFQHDTQFEQALAFSRFDTDHPLSTHSTFHFELEDKKWCSMEHYYQVAKHSHSDKFALKIFQSATPSKAYSLGNVWWRRKRKDFVQVRKTLMTRAAYSKAIQNEAVADYLLETADQLIIENSAYEHYWGIGRDQRGENTLGKIWMDVRDKLRERAGTHGKN